MSDFFTGEMLVFALLLPVLLRPFFRKLRDLKNIPVLALIALPLCFSTLLTGVRLLFVPLLLFTVVVLLSQSMRLIAIIRGLPTDYFGAGIKIVHTLLLLVFAAIVAASVFFPPEPAYVSTSELYSGSVREKFSAGFTYTFLAASSSDKLEKTESGRFLERFHQFTGNALSREDSATHSENGGTAGRNPSGGENARTPIVLYFPAFPAGRTGRDTLAVVLAEQGFTSVGVQWNGRQLYSKRFLNNRFARNFYELYLAIARRFNPEKAAAPYADFTGVQRQVLLSVIQDTAEFATLHFGGQRHIYAVAEGYACNALADFVNKNPGVFSGSVYLLNENEKEHFTEPETGCAYLSGITDLLHFRTAELPGLVISGTTETGFGFGEATAEDPALAALLGLPRDAKRKTAQVTARRIASWISLRNRFNIDFNIEPDAHSAQEEGI